METKDQQRLKFKGVEIVNVEWNLYQRFKNETPVNFGVVPRVFYPKEHPSRFQILMEVDIEAKEYFSLKLLAIGFFEIHLAEGESALSKSLVNANAPAIMFPYVRAYITTLTANSGTGNTPIILPTKFFSGEMEEYTDSQSSIEEE